MQPGDLFVARAGTKASGEKFVAEAVARGAVAVVYGGKCGMWNAECGNGECWVGVCAGRGCEFGVCDFGA